MFFIQWATRLVLARSYEEIIIRSLVILALEVLVMYIATDFEIHSILDLIFGSLKILKMK